MSLKREYVAELERKASTFDILINIKNLICQYV